MKKLLLISILLLAGRTACGQNSASPSLSPTPPCRARTLDLRASEIDYTATTGKAWGAPRGIAGLEVQCNTDYYGGIVNKKKGAHPASATTLDTAMYCDTLYGEGMYYYPDLALWQQDYDTLKKFIEICPNYPQSWRAFSVLAGAAQNVNGPDDAVMFQLQAWLESVLYLNTTDPEYFCQCVEAMPLPDLADSTPALGQLGTDRGLALDRWLLQHTTCDTAALRADYDNGRKEQYYLHSYDSMHGNLYPLDTTLPTMQQLGLDTLLDRHFLYSVGEQPISMITNATASPNPVSTGTVITFGISQEAYVKINIFDILGEPVSGGRVPGSGGEGFEGLFAPGNHEVPLSLQGLPSGTYFARILTAYGNVATVKLVKE
jgi:hypothetical protein